MARKAFSLLLCFSLLLVIFSLPTHALSFSDGLPSLSMAKHVYFANTDAKRILAKRDDELRIAPSSTTKIMTGLVALELGITRMNEWITVSEEMLRDVKGSHLGLVAGDQLRIRDVIAATVCGGFNDAAYVLAIALCGSSAAFVEQMNQKAKALGATQTVYVNPTGYDAQGAYTTLSDIVKIATQATKNDAYMEWSSHVVYDFVLNNTQESVRIFNRNALICAHYADGYLNEHAMGMIAGHTDDGYCLVTNAKIAGENYLCIIMGAAENGDVIGSYQIANALIRYAKENLGRVTVMEAGMPICSVPITLALPNTKVGTTELTASVLQDVTVFAPKTAKIGTDITYRYYLFDETLKAPIFPNTQVGCVDIYLGDELLETVPLLVTESMDASRFLIVMEHIKSFIMSRKALLSLIAFLILFPVGYYVCFLKPHKKVWKSKHYRYYS